MANLVSMERAVLTLGTTRLLDGVSLGVGDTERIGIVGRNGSGKSTLLRVLAGELPVQSGRIAVTTGLTSGLLGQADTLDPASTVRRIVLGGRADHEWAADPRIRDVLTGLLGDLDATGLGGWEAPVGPLSGGERRRIALAGQLVADPDLLLLDEPTNHLDVEGVAWLATHLAESRSRPGTALVMITHDRWFLDAVATSTWEVEGGQVRSYDGGYAAYVLAKAERARVAAVTAARQDNLLRKELAWLRRGPPARTSKPKFRIDAANALIEREPPPRDQVSLMRFATARLGKDVIDLLDVSVAFGEKTILDRVTWRLAPGDRIGIVGVNGSGKSTLLRVLNGDQAPDSGRRKVGKTVRTAYLTQDVTELDDLADVRVVDAVARVRQVIHLGDKELSASQLAQRLGFTGSRQQARVGDLSGGERRRLQLTRLLMTEPNVLILDEPTNDLDVETLTAVEDVLDDWPGTLLVVSHDRYLLERMCDRQVALLGDGKVRDLPGGVEEYLRLRAEARRAPRSGTSTTRAASPRAGGSTPAGAPAKVAPAATPAPSATPAQVRDARKEMARVERALTRLAEREERLHADLATHATDRERVVNLSASLAELHDERAELELSWLEAAEIAG